MSKKQILIVDDDATVLRVLERVVSFSLDCETTKALSGPQALDLMEKKSFDVIIADMRMPGMDGADLLNIVHELYPQTARLVFSARSGEEFGFKTISSAHQYFLKPMDIKVVAQRVEKLLRLRSLLPDQGLESIISQVNTLPSLPAVYKEMEEELNKRDASLDRVGRILERDVSMSMKVLHLVNSAFFGLREHVTRASHAAALLGLNVIKSLTLAVHVFSEWKGNVPGFSINELSNHSLNVAAGAQAIAQAERLDPQVTEEFYIAGLFHDIGKLVIAANLPESCSCIADMMQERRAPRIVVEKDVMGATHAEAGAFLLALWGFSDAVVQAGAFHHQPAQSEQKGLGPVMAVHVANVIDNEGKPIGKVPREEIDAAYIEAQGLTPKLAAWRNACSFSVAPQ
jgi:HD-like signal output (HDOD) protein/CheY-like chemotaxis protein